MIEYYEDQQQGVTRIEADGVPIAELSSSAEAHAVFMWLTGLDPRVQCGVIRALTSLPLTDAVVASI